LVGNISGKTFDVNAPNADVIDDTTAGTINVVDAANSSYYYNGTSSINFNDNNGRFVNENVTPANLTIGSNVTVTLGGTIGTVVSGSNSTITVEIDATVEEVQGDETVTIGGEGAGNVVGVNATVSTQEELTAALGNSSINTVILDQGFNLSSPVVIDRAVILEGNDQTVDFGFEVRTGNVVIQNLTITGQGFTDNVSGDSAVYVSDTEGQLVTFDNVTINYTTNEPVMVSGISAVSPNSDIKITNSTFNVLNEYQEGADSSVYTYGKIEVTDSVFNGATGIVIDNAGNNVVDIKGNEFNGTWVGVSLFNGASLPTKTSEETKVYLLDNNVFNEALGDYKVSVRNL
jgi:hypothetical protein